MSHIPEDRHKHGLVLDYSLEQNMVLQRYFEDEFQTIGFIKDDDVRDYANRLIEQYDVRSGQGPITISRTMSGGNQQKAIIARELDRKHNLLIAVQPTRGLDVGAIEYIHSQIIKSRDNGAAVLLVSFELEEVISIKDNLTIELRLKKFLLSSIESNKLRHLIQLKSKFMNSLLLNVAKVK